ncbi:hypothetical protein D915_009863 [Fasciola hepatica]|uniref:Uncharacterized protein n=1 Tax=Fasciola hepatica TaxID=6192 RepID=A0A4E0RW91_FASHE|nr:hypothetical protein D915_009863 [Fasciola hepatica]
MDCDSKQAASRTPLLRPAVPTLKAFSPGDNFALWEVRAKTQQQDAPSERLGRTLLPLLAGDAAWRFLAKGVPTPSGTDITWPTLDELFERPPVTKISDSVALHGRMISAKGILVQILGKVVGSASIERLTVKHQFLCAEVALQAILGMGLLWVRRIAIYFDKQRLVKNKRPGPMGQHTAAPRVEDSWIGEMLL